MKLVVAVVQDQDVGRLMDGLMENGFSATKLASTGGFLREGNTTVLIGIDDEAVEQVVGLVNTACQSCKRQVSGKSKGQQAKQEITVGGATMFVLDVEKFEKV